MDKILMKNLSFFGYHGVLSEENKLGQKFFIDAELFVDLKEAGTTDKVEKTVHYGLAYEKIKEIVEGKPLNLIEALAENIAQSILDNFERVNQIKVTVRKPEAPVNGIYDYFGVEIVRGRDA